MRSTSFNIVNLGCKVNRVEADSMAASFMARGLQHVAEEAADIVVVNTCTVTAEADKKARKAVRHAIAANPLADVLVTGCAAAISPGVFESMDPRVRVVGKNDLLEKLSCDGPEPVLRVGGEFRTRVGLKVQDGCDHACTYCIVHVARGPARSVPAERVLAEARAHFSAGVKETVLAGIDIGAYRDGETGLAQLCEMLLEEAGLACDGRGPKPRIRISSIEPMNVDDALIGVLSRSEGAICRHLHIPLQSGSSKVLREMDRPYDAEEFMTLVAKLRERIPEIALSTDVIVGFPGETEDDFEQTMSVVRQAGFMRLHVFPYSPRQGTPAASRNDQVDGDVKRERAARLRDLGARLAQEDLESRRGTVELCLIEDTLALSESYHEIASPDGAMPGELVPVAL